MSARDFWYEKYVAELYKIENLSKSDPDIAVIVAIAEDMVNAWNITLTKSGNESYVTEQYQILTQVADASGDPAIQDEVHLVGIDIDHLLHLGQWHNG